MALFDRLPDQPGAAAVGERLFVTSEEPMLHCVDATSGAPQWQAPGISQFAAVTKSHVYGVDRFATIHILNIADGAPVGRIATGGTVTALVNDQTDRLFLISENGLVQCLHEIGADEPTYYAKPSTAGKPPKAEEGEPAGEKQPDNPFGQPAAPAEKANPFGGPAEPVAPEKEKEKESDFGTGETNLFE